MWSSTLRGVCFGSATLMIPVDNITIIYFGQTFSKIDDFRRWFKTYYTRNQLKHPFKSHCLWMIVFVDFVDFRCFWITLKSIFRLMLDYATSWIFLYKLNYLIHCSLSTKISLYYKSLTFLGRFHSCMYAFIIVIASSVISMLVNSSISTSISGIHFVWCTSSHSWCNLFCSWH